MRFPTPRVGGLCMVCLSLLVASALAIPCFAQKSNYATWDRFFYKFQLPIKAAAPESQVRLSVYHSYPSTLHNVRVLCDSKVMRVVTRPGTIPVLDPTEIRTIVLDVRNSGQTNARSTAKLALRLVADELAGSRPIILTVPLTKAAEGEVAEAMAMPVGRMEVTVSALGRAGLYIYAALTVLVLAWFLRRRARAER